MVPFADAGGKGHYAIIVFIIGGDFQCDPSNPMINAWADALDAVVVATDEVTCRTSNVGGSRIDYVIVHKDVAPHIRKVEVLEVESNPHRPVQLVLEKTPRTQSELVARKPKPLPEEIVIGPSRFQPVEWKKCDRDNAYSDMDLEQHARWVMEGIEE